MKHLPRFLMCGFGGIFSAAVGFPATTVNGFVVTAFVAVCISEFYRRTEK